MGFEYRDNTLYCEHVPLADIAKHAGTPCYVYSASMIINRFREYNDAFADVDHEVCYAVKANSNVSVLRLLAENRFPESERPRMLKNAQFYGVASTAGAL